MSELVPLLNVENVSTSIEFYETILGSTVESSWESGGCIRWARLRFDGGSLMLNTRDDISSDGRESRAEIASGVKGVRSVTSKLRVLPTSK